MTANRRPREKEEEEGGILLGIDDVHRKQGVLTY